jgi:hypothetical protein
MNAFEAIPVLDRLLKLLCRSLPAYLADARPWARAGDRRIQAALDRLVADQQMYARRVAEAITERGGRPDPGRFPTALTAKNDLGLDFLLQEVIADQQRAAAAIEHCAAQLENLPSLHSLAEEIFGNVRGHLDIFKEMTNAESQMPRE